MSVEYLVDKRIRNFPVPLVSGGPYVLSDGLFRAKDLVTVPDTGVTLPRVLDGKAAITCGSEGGEPGDRASLPLSGKFLLALAQEENVHFPALAD